MRPKFDDHKILKTKYKLCLYKDFNYSEGANDEDFIALCILVGGLNPMRKYVNVSGLSSKQLEKHRDDLTNILYDIKQALKSKES